MVEVMAAGRAATEAATAAEATAVEEATVVAVMAEVMRVVAQAVVEEMGTCHRSRSFPNRRCRIQRQRSTTHKYRRPFGSRPHNRLHWSRTSRGVCCSQAWPNSQSTGCLEPVAA